MINPQNITVSIFKNFHCEGLDCDISYVLNKIKTGGDFESVINRIRESTDHDEQQKLKRTLPGVTFCGTFRKRVSNKVINGTGLVILDFDEKGQPPEMSEYFYALWKSPRLGYKALVKIPVVNNDSEFKKYFYSIQSHFPEIDPSGKDISRFCFISLDSDLYFNENSKIWTKTIEDDVSAENKGHRSDYKKLTIAIQMIENADVGNRNNTFLKAGRLMGGYIATGELNEIDVLEICERAIYDKDPTDSRTNFKTFRNGIAYGKQNPLSSQETKEILTEVKIGKIDFTLNEADTQLEDMYENGYVKGYLSGWSHFDDYYSMRPGFTTYIYGAPFSGKSLWWFNLLINTSKRYGLRHMIYSPETGEKHDVFALLISIYAEGDVTNTFGNRITREKFEESKIFIEKHFIIISTDETDTDLTPEELLDYADVVEAKHGVKIHTLTIDPWNELNHHEESARDLYLNKALKHVRMKARKKERHICIITHIRDQKPIAYDNFGTAIMPFPTPHDIAGGQVWYRKGFMMLGFYRHFVADGQDSVDLGRGNIFHKNQLSIRVQKYKPEGTGKRGEIQFHYHAHRHQFSSMDGGFPISNQSKTINDDYDEEIPF
jgi:hypothetical protein